MALRWAGPVWRLWLVLFLPLLAALLLTFSAQPFYAALLIWWLKPVLDRFLLHVCAHAVFGEVPTMADSLGAWRSVLGARLWPSLLLRPFAWSRSFLAPVAQLERQRGPAARRRASLLGRRLGGHVLALALVCLCFEAVVFIGLWGLLDLIVPAGWLGGDGDESAPLLWEPEWWGMQETLLYALAVTLVEPFFVAAGFSLYLNRRVMLEGWDIELGLRRLAKRAAAGARSGLVVLLLALPLCLGGQPALAQEQSLQELESKIESKPAAKPESPQDVLPSTCRLPEPGDSEDWDEHDDEDWDEDHFQDDCPSAPAYVPQETAARRAVLEVLASPDFGGEQEVSRWLARRTDSDSPTARVGWLADLAGLVAEVLRSLAWLLMALLVLAVIWSIARHWRREGGEGEAEAAPGQLFGLAISPDSLPPDVAEAARGALRRGELREALSLLYRGALSFLVHQRGLRIGGGATEGDVLRLSGRLLAAPTQAYLARLMPVWIDLAYAHRAPRLGALDALCDEYPRHFADAAAQGRAAE